MYATKTDIAPAICLYSAKQSTETSSVPVRRPIKNHTRRMTQLLS